MTQTPKARVANLVREAMREGGLTQERVATAIDLPQESVSRRVRGVTDWRASELVIVAGLLGIPTERFFRDTDDAERAEVAG